MRCQLCDGPIVNGRCRDCGMPYRKDELLYHLNEDRRTHEKHATNKAREELLKRMVPLGDTVKQSVDQAVQKNVQKKAGKMTGKTIVQPSGQTLQQAKQKQKSAAKNKKEFGRSNNSSWNVETKGKKKKSLGSVLFWILVVLVILGSSAGELVTEWKEEETYTDTTSLEDFPKKDVVYTIGEPGGNDENDTYSFSSWSGSDGRTVYELVAGFGSVEVGMELPSGDYRIYTDNDEVKMIYKKSDEKKAEVFELKEGDTLEMFLAQGDILKLDGNGDSYKSMYFQELD